MRLGLAMSPPPHWGPLKTKPTKGMNKAENMKHQNQSGGGDCHAPKYSFFYYFYYYYFFSHSTSWLIAQAKKRMYSADMVPPPKDGQTGWRSKRGGGGVH